MCRVMVSSCLQYMYCVAAVPVRCHCVRAVHVWYHGVCGTCVVVWCPCMVCETSAKGRETYCSKCEVFPRHWCMQHRFGVANPTRFRYPASSSIEPVPESRWATDLRGREFVDRWMGEPRLESASLGKSAAVSIVSQKIPRPLTPPGRGEESKSSSRG